MVIVVVYILKLANYVIGWKLGTFNSYLMVILGQRVDAVEPWNKFTLLKSIIAEFWFGAGFHGILGGVDFKVYEGSLFSL